MLRFRFNNLTRTIHRSLTSAGRNRSQTKVDPIIQQRQHSLLSELNNALTGKPLNKFCGGSINYRSLWAKDIPPLLISYNTRKDSNVNNSTDSSIGANSSHTGTSNFIRFPIPNKSLETAAIELLIKAGSPANVGRGNQEILHPTYRQAIKLSASEIATQFHPGSTDILNILSRFLWEHGTNHTDVKAVLDKLNVYGPGGFFKTHVDTPQGVGHFGSLVVCLPTTLKGGQLVLREPVTGVEKVVDWSTDEPSSIIKWLAFLDSVEHEVLEVREGYRVTLTYNLHHANRYNDDDQALGTYQPAPNVTTVPAASVINTDSATSLIQSILSRLSNESDFAPNGLKLGYYCQHKYSALDVKNSSTDGATESPRLRGLDFAFFNAAKSLNLKPEIVREYYIKSDVQKLINSDVDDYEDDAEYVDEEFNDDNDEENDDEYHNGNNVFAKSPNGQMFPRYRHKKIVWLGKRPNPFDHVPWDVLTDYGKDHSCETIWEIKLILVKIPKLEERVQSV
ncbi:hypothetical protein HDU76_003955 [Blyttiomyces sp. JEL0837]|nr:hypothetical protein HDU76_003955 [Blyttiomyces sp. JEL0837]